MALHTAPSPWQGLALGSNDSNLQVSGDQPSDLQTALTVLVRCERSQRIRGRAPVRTRRERPDHSRRRSRLAIQNRTAIVSEYGVGGRGLQLQPRESRYSRGSVQDDWLRIQISAWQVLSLPFPAASSPLKLLVKRSSRLMSDKAIRGVALTTTFTVGSTWPRSLDYSELQPLDPPSHSLSQKTLALTEGGRTLTGHTLTHERQRRPKSSLAHKGAQGCRS